MRLGIRQKLFLAVGVIAAMAVVSSLISFGFFGQVRGALSGVTERSIPAVSAALTLAAQSADLAAAAPTLAYAAGEGERKSALGELQAKLVQIDRTVAQVKSSDAPAEIREEVESTVVRLADAMQRIDDAVKERLALAGKRQELTKTLTDNHANFLFLAQPAVDQAVMDMTMEFELVSRATGQGASEMIQSILDKQVAGARAIQDLVAKVNLTVGMLAVAAQADSPEQVELIQVDNINTKAEMLRSLDTVQSVFPNKEIAEAVEAMARASEGETGLFQVRMQELAAARQAVSSLSEARSAASALADAVDQLVTAARTETDTSTKASMTAINIAQTSMAIIAVICLISAVVIGWLYIGRRVIDPIVATTGTMDRLAKRDWQTEVTGLNRTDEIGDMARAVQVFKEQGQEADKLQSQIESDRERFEQERKAQEALLKSAVGEIVGAANAGDLSQRIDTTRINGVMRELGEGVNQLLTTMDRALGDLGNMMHKLADGDLTHRIRGNYQGLFARLANDANQVSDRLAGTMKQLASAAALVRDASAEISTGSQDLAQRTESQAAALEQTAASMHEVTATVKQNADNAQAANQLATAARDTAEKGGGVVGRAVAAVTQIETSAQKIVDIVSLIDEIAFQTNLLALNASVEAARAGEAGKGFAVVAQEVRALAQRSANASKDIKALIQESNAQVKTGATLVNQAGSSLTEIVTAIKKVSDIVAEIAAASAEQARGLEEVNGAVVNMDEMTQRNGALVEQTNASAQAMADQARQLAELVGHFRFEGTAAANDRLAQAEIDTLEAGDDTMDNGDDAAKDAAD
ncbi:methyl-accepting chemotaxis protein [Ferrovibrio sp.]|jgi:methyl-accepting chemotaxis protein|uniref:methyl-accepting chemotaxis protein n=2 Tax=Ferrovibrio sp. TaxID=1917215 RepID=UPI0035B2040B